MHPTQCMARLFVSLVFVKHLHHYREGMLMQKLTFVVVAMLVVASNVLAQSITVNVPTQLDWNLVSLPVSNPSPTNSVLDLFLDSALPHAHCFDNPGTYMYCSPPPTTMSEGKGYFIRILNLVNNPQPITGTDISSLSIPVGGGPGGVGAGWNLVGSISHPISAVSVATVGTTILSNFFGYTNGYFVATTIEPGKGYWVKVSGPGSLEMLSPIAPTVSKEAVRVVQSVASGRGRSIKDLNTLTVRDANGGLQTLYFGADANGEIPVNMYAMPPAPPTGSFDARFATSGGGTMVQTHPEEMNDVIDLPIAIQTVAYPLTVSWKATSGSYELSDGVGGVYPVRGEGSLKIMSGEVHRLVLKVTGNSGLPKEFALSQNYPNPFNPTTNIKYALPVDSRVTVEIYNVIGQRVHTLVNDMQPAGYYVAEWNGTGNTGQQLASGVYFLHLSAQGVNGKSFNEIRKLMMLK